MQVGHDTDNGTIGQVSRRNDDSSAETATRTGGGVGLLAGRSGGRARVGLQPGSIGEAGDVERVGDSRGLGTAARMAADKRQDAIAGWMPANQAAAGGRPRRRAGCPDRRQDASSGSDGRATLAAAGCRPRRSRPGRPRTGGRMPLAGWMPAPRWRRQEAASGAIGFGHMGKRFK